MPLTKGESIVIEPNEEHFIRRLGGAVVVHWDKLSADMQELLVQQAADMLDPHPIVQADFQIKEFIRKHKGGDK